MASVIPFEPIVRRATPLVQRAVAAVAPRVRRRHARWMAPTRAAVPLHVVPREAARVAPAVGERALARVYFAAVLLIAALDLATKAWAVAELAGAPRLAVAPGFSLALVFNTASAGGVWLGEHTRALNFAATGVVIGLLTMLVPHVARVDRRGTHALALMAGGGLGNLASLGTSTRGVPDFLAIHHAHGAWVLNVADVAIFGGLAMLGAIVARLAAKVVRGEARLLERVDRW